VTVSDLFHTTDALIIKLLDKHHAESPRLAILPN
jgi:hypothetical protein